MRKLVLQMGVSLDGIVAGPNPVAADHDEKADAWKVQTLGDAGAHLMGRVTYLEMAAYWPTSTELYAESMNTIPKVVSSRTLEHAGWPQTQIARGDMTEEINELKRQPGGDLIAHGGATFVQELSRRGLVDQYRLLVLPGAAGSGAPLFKEPINLDLLDVQAFPSGAIGMTYRPRG